MDPFTNNDILDLTNEAASASSASTPQAIAPPRTTKLPSKIGDHKWTIEETEQLLGLMEEDPSILQYPTAAGRKYKKAFISIEITETRIMQKVSNLKRTYAKTRRECENMTGFGIREEDCESSIAALLLKKCRWFFRLEAIFGSRSNINAIAPAETLTYKPPALSTLRAMHDQDEASEPEKKKKKSTHKSDLSEILAVAAENNLQLQLRLGEQRIAAEIEKDKLKAIEELAREKRQDEREERQRQHQQQLQQQLQQQSEEREQRSQMLMLQIIEALKK